MTPRRRCAIYTRKSTEEGFDQAFNSLDAQRESCEAYVLSQAGEGWECLPDRFDDGGWSGGNMDRPAMKHLLEDIRQGRVDIVVYKVDRLTRSLMDFARIVETFDSNNVSFVSVAQAFNTTNSMGRLTLNVLLSLTFRTMSVTSSRAPAKLKNLCRTFLTEVTAAPWSEESSTRRAAQRQPEPALERLADNCAFTRS